MILYALCIAGQHISVIVAAVRAEIAITRCFPHFRCFRGKLLQLSLHPVANFVMQRLFALTRQPAHAVAFCSELLEDRGQAIKALFEAKRSSVVLMLVTACAKQRVAPQQKALARSVAVGVDALQPPASLELLQRLLTLPEAENPFRRKAAAKPGAKKRRGKRKDAQTIATVGAQIVQGMLRFEPVRHIILCSAESKPQLPLIA